MTPMIGLTASLESQKISTLQNYAEPLLKAGALPVVLPYSGKLPVIQDIINRMNGLLLTGGADINPTLFGEEPAPGLQKVDPKRDRFELMLVQEALKSDIPILAICRGNQMLNVAAGGTLYQDLFGLSHVIQHHQNAPRDHLSHSVQITADTQLHQILGFDQLKVNSFHHSAVKDPAPGFSIAATASDAVTEAIESQNHRFVLGVQWHPGDLAEKEPRARKLFQAFVGACTS
ncbi:MAG TPA: gamma-glutamyl-gamma-aminobutyrate hydrolase family protein [Bacillales bacterium]|nr:gamma-glutamyl-gamma-aminobutyrate hydrolase family protein [Bacillales bacterium]